MIFYRDGYDGQLAETVQFQLPANLWPAELINTEFLVLNKYGILTIRSGYAWDYASVPVTHWISNKIDGNRSKTPSLVHDALCQLIRDGQLTVPDARLHADEHFYQLLLDRGFLKLRAWLWFQAVKLGGKRFKQKPREVYTAP